MSERIERIKKAIEQREKCRATHLHSVPVIEKHEGETVWGGVVETFDLEGHPTAKRAYAWERKKEERGDAEYTVVLGIGTVTSAQAAVQAAIVAILKSIEKWTLLTKKSCLLRNLCDGLRPVPR